MTRRVDMLHAISSTLAQAYEQARIEEVRYTPVITLVDEPEGSARPSPATSRTFAGMAALLLGWLLAAAIAGTAEYLARQRRVNPAGYTEFQTFIGKLRHLGRRRSL